MCDFPDSLQLYEISIRYENVPACVFVCSINFVRYRVCGQQMRFCSGTVYFLYKPYSLQGLVSFAQTGPRRSGVCYCCTQLSVINSNNIWNTAGMSVSRTFSPTNQNNERVGLTIAVLLFSI